MEDTDWDVFRDTLDVDLKSVFLGTKAAIGAMKTPGGSIINISSIAATTPDISQVAYGTSKAAIDQMTKLTAVQAGQYNIRCNAVLPGMTATDAVKDNLSDAFRDIFLKQTPLKRMAKPEEIAAAAAYFASDDAANPAKFYMVSAPAHKACKTTFIPIEKAAKKPLIQLPQP